MLVVEQALDDVVNQTIETGKFNRAAFRRAIYSVDPALNHIKRFALCCSASIEVVILDNSIYYPLL